MFSFLKDLSKRFDRWMRSIFSQRKYQVWVIAGILLISFGFIGLILFKNWSLVSDEFWRFQPINLVYAFAAFPLGMIPTVIAWHYLLRALNVNVPFPVNLQIYSLSAIPRHVPGLVLYVSGRSLMYDAQGVPPAKIVTATALEMVLLSLVGFGVGLVVFLANLGTILQQNYMQAVVMAAFMLVIIAIIVIFIPRIKPVRQLLSGRLKDMRLKRVDLAYSLFWMVLAWIGGGLFLHLLALAVTPVSLTDFDVMVGIWAISGAMSMTLGALVQGFGIREFTMGSLLTLLVPPAVAVVVALGFRLAFTLFELVWVLLFVAAIRWLPVQKSSPVKDAVLPKK